MMLKKYYNEVEMRFLSVLLSKEKLDQIPKPLTKEQSEHVSNALWRDIYRMVEPVDYGYKTFEREVNKHDES